MKIIQNESNISLSADENKLIIDRYNTDLSGFKSLVIPLGIELSRYQEVPDTNVPKKLVTVSTDLQGYSIDELKDYLISQSKINLEDFLSLHPLSANIKGDTKFYGSTEKHQSRLNSIIDCAEDAEKLGIFFVPMWNALNENREPWTINELKILRIKIQEYVLPLILQQQIIEQNIMSLSDYNELILVDLGYNLN